MAIAKNNICDGRIQVLSAITLVGVLLFLIFKPLGYSPDYFQYLYYFESVATEGFEELMGYRFEPGFSILSYGLSYFFSSSAAIFAAITLISVYIKISAIRVYSSFIGLFLALALFFVKYFPLQDYNQLRAALSMGVVLLYFNSFGGNVWRQVFLCILALSFHYSAALVLPFVFFSKYVRARYQLFLLAVFIFIALKIISAYVIEFLMPFLSVVEMYEEGGAASARNFALSPVFYPEFVTIFLSLMFWGQLNDIVKRVVAIQIFGFIFFYGFIDLQAFAVRGREFFSVFWLIYMAQFHESRLIVRISQIFFLLTSFVLGLYLFYFSDFMTHDIRFI